MSTITRKNLQNMPAPTTRDIITTWVPNVVVYGGIVAYFVQMGVWAFVSAFLTPDVQKKIGGCGGFDSINRFYLDNGSTGQPVVYAYDTAADQATCVTKADAVLHPYHLASWFIAVGVVAVVVNFAWHQLDHLFNLNTKQRDIIEASVNVMTAVLAVAGLIAFIVTGVHLMGVVFGH